MSRGWAVVGLVAIILPLVAGSRYYSRRRRSVPALGLVPASIYFGALAIGLGAITAAELGRSGWLAFLAGVLTGVALAIVLFVYSKRVRARGTVYRPPLAATATGGAIMGGIVLTDVFPTLLPFMIAGCGTCMAVVFFTAAVKTARVYGWRTPPPSAGS